MGLLSIIAATGGSSSSDGGGIAGSGFFGLLATDTTPSLLYQLAADSGLSTLISALGADDVRGLAFDHNPNTLYGTDIHVDQLITMQGLAFR